MQELLGRLAMAGKSGRTVERILTAFPIEESSKGAGNLDGQLIDRSSDEYPSLLAPLTPREKQILALLQEPVSMKELALNLGLQYSTVKRHAINIYGKLGVNSRWDAVAKAKALNILPG
jgi:ATP/maltotriose-dependent transcriptional regulator MalT